MTGNQSVSSVLSACKSQVESQLDKHLPRADSAPQRLHEAMRYAVLNGGKRVRAALVYMTGDALGAPKELPPAGVRGGTHSRLLARSRRFARHGQ